MEILLSAGILRLRTAYLNIPEADCCGEAVEGAFIQLIAEENCHDERRTSGRSSAPGTVSRSFELPPL
jgi:hypothetical protein